MKKNNRVTPGLEESVTAGVVAGLAAAQMWATPHMGAAYGWAKPRWEKGLDTARPALQDTVRKAAEGISGGIAVVTPRIQTGLDKVGPRITHVIDETTPKIQSTLDKAAPALNSAKVKVVEDYLPALSSKLGEAADSASRSLAGASVPPIVEKTVTRVTGDKKAVKNAQKRLVAATKEAAKELKKNQARKSRKGWLIFGIIAAAVIAGVAAWQASKPVQDPWKTPAPIKATPPPAPVSAERSQEVKKVMADVKEAADRAAAKSAEDVEDVKKKTAEAAETGAAKTKDATENAKHSSKPADESKA